MIWYDTTAAAAVSTTSLILFLRSHFVLALLYNFEIISLEVSSTAVFRPELSSLLPAGTVLYANG